MSATLISDKLKAALLQSAIQGKLTRQLPKDGDARDLLKQIEAEKERLINEKVIKKEKPLPEITEDEIPFDIPDNWVWVRFNQVLDVRDGTHESPKYHSQGIPLITSKNLKNNTIDFDNVKFISKEDALRINSRSKVDIGDIIFAMIGSIGNPVINNSNTNFSIKNVALFKNFSQMLSIKYFYFYLLFAEIEMQNNASGGVQRFISLTDLRNYIFPLPPLKEQHRIVEAIETALAKIDKLKVDETKLYNIQTAFPTKLRASLLQSAIQGKLTQQLPEDGDARDLLKQIEAEKEQLINKKVIKKEKPLPEITEDEIPFDIPDNWVWVRFNQVLDVRDGTHESPKYHSQGIPLITSKNLKNNTIDFDNVKFISKEDALRINSRSKVDIGDIIFAMIGSIGNPVINNSNTNFSIKNVALFKNFSQMLSIKYFYFYLLFAEIEMQNNASGGVQRFISLTDLRNYIFPLPPLKEQHRIVETIEKALAKINKLNKLTE